MHELALAAGDGYDAFTAATVFRQRKARNSRRKPGQVRHETMGLRGLRVLLDSDCDLDIVHLSSYWFCDPGHVLSKALVTSDVMASTTSEEHFLHRSNRKPQRQQLIQTSRTSHSCQKLKSDSKRVGKAVCLARWMKIGRFERYARRIPTHTAAANLFLHINSPAPHPEIISLSAFAGYRKPSASFEVTEVSVRHLRRLFTGHVHGKLVQQ